MVTKFFTINYSIISKSNSQSIKILKAIKHIETEIDNCNMKIMLIGAATSNHTKRWAKAMAERGHNVLLICRPDQKDNMNDLSSNVAIKYLKYPGKNIGYYLNIPCIRKYFNEFKPNVVNVQYASGYGAMARMARLTPLVLSVFGSDVYIYPFKNKFNHYIIRKNLNYASAVASTSKAMAEQTKLLMGKDFDVTVTPFGVDINKFSKTKREDNKRPIIGIVKYLEPIYDIPLLINAFAIVHSQESIKPLLHIYGGGHLLDELKALCVQLDIQDDVKFFGTIPNDQIPKALNTFDIFVNCSINESFGVAIVEAMSCELPVVATNTPGFREVVDDGKTGYILKDRNPQTMANAFQELLHNPSKRLEMGQKGRQKVLEEYDWSKNVSTMENLFKRCCNK